MDERANPEHHLETLGVQGADHGFRLGELLLPEFPLPVILLPVVVNHQHAGGKPVVPDGLGVFQDVGFVLIVLQFNPGVILRGREEQLVRELARGREMCPARVKVGVAQGSARPGLEQPAVFAVHRQAARGQLKRERVFGPDHIALTRKEQGLGLVAVVIAAQIRLVAVSQRHPVAVVNDVSPPVGVGGDWNQRAVRVRYRRQLCGDRTGDQGEGEKGNKVLFH